MTFIQRDNARIFYELAVAPKPRQCGSPWVTLINGHTRTSNDFRQMSKFLQDAGFNVVTLDNRGCGKTVFDGPGDGRAMVEDVVAIWDENAIAHSAVLGISMGGMIAQHLMAQYQQRVWAGILVSTTCNRRNIISSRTPWVADLAKIRAKLELFFAPQFVENNPMLVDAMAKNILKAMEGGRFQAGAQQQTQAMNSFSDALLRLIKIPVLVIHGAEDRVVLPEAAPELASQLLKAEVKIYENAGHLLLAETPRRLYGDVVEFLNSQG